MGIRPVVVDAAVKLLLVLAVYVQKSCLPLLHNNSPVKPWGNQMTVHGGYLLLLYLKAGHIHQTDLMLLKHIPVEGLPVHKYLPVDAVYHVKANAGIRNLHAEHPLLKLRALHQYLHRKSPGVHLSHHGHGFQLIASPGCNVLFPCKQDFF